MARPLDVRERTDLTKNKRPVDAFRLVGYLAELALARSLVAGVGSLCAADLPNTIEMRLDKLGVRDMRTRHEDRLLAVRIAKFVRAQLVDHGINVVEAIVPDSTGEHDLIGDAVHRDYIRGQVSIELKCRRLWSEQGKEDTRAEQRRECVEECRWWKAAVTQNPGKWGGRAILLVNLEENQRLTSRCECKLMQGSWEAWWGWRSSSLAARPKAKAKATAAPPPPPPVAVAPRPKAKAVPKAMGKPRDQPFPALSYRREPPGAGNPLVATVQSLFNGTDPKRPIGNIGRSIGDVKRRRRDELGNWTPGGKHTDELFEAPRRSGLRPGSGRPEWVATQRVMRIIHAELP